MRQVLRPLTYSDAQWPREKNKKKASFCGWLSKEEPFPQKRGKQGRNPGNTAHVTTLEGRRAGTRAARSQRQAQGGHLELGLEFLHRLPLPALGRLHHGQHQPLALSAARGFLREPGGFAKWNPNEKNGQETWSFFKEETLRCNLAALWVLSKGVCRNKLRES